MRSSFAVVTLAVVAVCPASANDPVLQSELPNLVGKKLWIARSSQNLRGSGGPRYLFVGEEVTLKGQDKHMPSNAVVQTAAGQECLIYFGVLSRSKPAYALWEPGKLEILIPRLFAEAYDTAARCEEILKRQERDPEAAERLCKECNDMFVEHSRRLRSFIQGKGMRDYLLKKDEEAWLGKAEEIVVVAYADGIRNLDAWRNSNLLKQAKSALEILEGVEQAAGAARGLASARAMLKRAQADKNEYNTKRAQDLIGEHEPKMKRGFEEAAKARKALGF